MLSVVISFLILLSPPTLDEVREMYRQSAKNEKTCIRMIDMLQPFNENNHPLYAGYKASAIMMMAQHTSNPFQKWSYFNRGKKLLEKAISRSPNNVELRCLRFAVQANVPAITGYTSELETDKRFILSRYSHVREAALQKNIRYFLQEWGDLTLEERKKLQ